MRAFVYGLLGGIVGAALLGALLLAVLGMRARSTPPSFAHYTSDQVVEAFRTRGLRATDTKLEMYSLELTELTRLGAPPKDVRAFSPGNVGAYVVTFASQPEMDIARGYYDDRRSSAFPPVVRYHRNVALVTRTYSRGYQFNTDPYFAALVGTD
jgi:hypothetical protein